MTLLIALALMQIDPKVAKREIQARYDALDTGFRKKDASVLDHFMTEDFTTESPAGATLDRDAALQSIRGLMMSSHHAKWPRKVIKLTLNGSDVVAIVEGYFTGEVPGKDGKLQKIELKTTVEDTWVHKPDGWEIEKSHMIKVSSNTPRS